MIIIIFKKSILIKVSAIFQKGRKLKRSKMDLTLHNCLIIKAEAENLLKEKKSLKKSSNNFEQQTMGLNKNLPKKTIECEIMNNL